VFAKWFTGTIYIEQGDTFDPSTATHRLMGTFWERTLLVDITEGVVTKVSTRDNREHYKNWYIH